MKRILFFSLIGAVFMFGCKLTNPTASFSCTGFNLSGENAFSEIDNTGLGAENSYYRATDGAGTILFYGQAGPGGGLLSNGSGSGPFSDSKSFSVAPQYNPITLELLDPPGGSLTSEKVFYTFTGICPGLPEYVSDDYQKIGQVQVVAPGVALYQDPAGDVVRDASFNEIWVPNQTADNPSEDIYDVLDQATVDGTTWISIFTGNVNYPVWIPVGGPVQILTLAE